MSGANMTTTGFSVHSTYLFKSEGDIVFSASLLIIVIMSLLIITGFICLAKIITAQQKRLNELEHKVNEDAKKTIIYVDKSEFQPTTTDDIEKTGVLQNNEINQMVDSYLVFNDQDDEGDIPGAHEANIMKVNKNDGGQKIPVSPGGISLNSAEQLYTFDIVVEKTPIDKAIKDDFIGEKR